MTGGKGSSPVYASQLADGTYPITVQSSSSMFRIVAAQLTVSGGQMEVCMTLSGTGYEKLFMGTGEQALAAPDEDCVYFVEDGEGAYTYTVPVEALDQETDCAAWSIRKQSWYDRVLVFQSDGLPQEAYVARPVNPLFIAAGCAAALVVLAGAGLLWKRKHKKET